MVAAQLAGSLAENFAGVVAYEPVWAIGTGLTPSLEQIAEVHAAIRSALIDRLVASGLSKTNMGGRWIGRS